MEGDTFEMEDQRNWSDASYKTYVRPLARPWPYTLPKGVKVEQAVRLSVSGKAVAAAAGAAQKPVEIRLGGQSGTMPMIGIGVPADEAEPALRSIDLAADSSGRNGSPVRSISGRGMAARNWTSTAGSARRRAPKSCSRSSRPAA